MATLFCSVLITLLLITQLQGVSAQESEHQWGSLYPLKNDMKANPTIIQRSNGNQIAASKPGDIMLFDPSYESKIPGAQLEHKVGIIPIQDNGRTYDKYFKTIVSSDNQNIGGFFVDTPSPDPSGRFQSLVNDPYFSGLRKDLQSAMRPDQLIPEPGPDCREDECVAIIPSADVYYFSDEPTNTNCVGGTDHAKPTTTPPKDMKDTNTYIVYANAEFFNKCRKWLGAYTGFPMTMTIPAGAVQTVDALSDPQNPTLKQFDYKDLPCPPDRIAKQLSEGQPYYPILPSPYQLAGKGVNLNSFDGMDPYKQRGFGCTMGLVRDPPSRSHRVNDMSFGNVMKEKREVRWDG